MHLLPYHWKEFKILDCGTFTIPVVICNEFVKCELESNSNLIQWPCLWRRKSAASTLTSTASDQVKPTKNLIAMTSSPGAAASNDNVINYNSDVIINGHKNPMERSGGNENNAAGEKSKNTGCHGQLLSEPPAATASISPLVPSLTVTDCASSQGDLARSGH